MEWSTLILMLVILMAGYVLKSSYQMWLFFKKVKKLPTTANLPIYGHVWQLMVPQNKLVAAGQVIVNTSPSPFVLWLGPVPIFVVTKAKHIETILGSPKHIDKPFHYEFLEPWLGTGLLTSTGKKWHAHRKMITPTFHFKILESFLEIFAEKSEILIRMLKKEIGSESFDVYPYITTCALDIICETAMGIELNAQARETPSEYVNAVLRITVDLMKRMQYPWMYPDFIFKITPSGRRLKNYVRILHKFSLKVIQDRRELRKHSNNAQSSDEDYYLGRRKKKAFLDLLLDSSDTESQLTVEEIREEVDTFMFEGHDTTTAGICWAIYILGSHQDVQEKVYQELESIFQGSDRSPSMKDLNEMKYLERVIKESLRLYPSVPFFGRVLKEDVELDGYTVPAGVKVMIPPYYVHRQTENFKNPDTFNPDNFLPENIANRHPYAYIPFSAGPRNCIGQKFALLEEKVVLSYILRNYEIKATCEIVTPLLELILRPEDGVHLKISPRVKSR